MERGQFLHKDVSANILQECSQRILCVITVLSQQTQQSKSQVKQLIKTRESVTGNENSSYSKTNLKKL